MTSPAHDEWPDDPDGEVLRRLRGNGFDFTKQYVIDFSVDFEEWPPNPEALGRIRGEFPNASVYFDDVSGKGSVVVKVEATLSYPLVVHAQQRLTELASEFGGWCDLRGY